LDAAETGVIERFGRDDDELGGRAPSEIDLALRPELGQVMTPRFLQTLEEEVGAAEQQHLGRGRVALGQGGQVLVDDRLEEAGDDLLDRHAGLHQRVGVGLGEDAALARDLVEAHALVRHRGQTLAGHLQLARGLLDERAGAAAAGRLHVDLLRPARAGGGEEDRLHVLAADLRDEPHVRMLALDAGGDGHDFLDQLGADQGRDEARARAGEEDAVRAGRQAGLGLHAPEELLDLLGLAGIVPLIVLPADLTVLHHHRLDGGGADVDADQLHDFPIRVATCRTSFAAVPAAAPSWGIAYVAFFISGCRSTYARTSSTPRPVRASVSSNSRWARFFASVRIIWQRDRAWTSASPLISSGAYRISGYLPITPAMAPIDIVFGMHEYGDSSQIMWAFFL